jgi:hypothetical protein
MTEHSINLGNHIQLQNITILSTKPRYMDQIISEAIEIELHPNNMNGIGGLYLSRHGSPKSTPSKDLGNLRHNSACPTWTLD